METAGLIFGIFGLSSAFKDCIDLLKLISAARAFDQNSEILSTRLVAQELRLLQWAERVKRQEGQSRSLPSPAVQAGVEKILLVLQKLLSNAKELQHKYGLLEISQDTDAHEPTKTLDRQTLNNLCARLEKQFSIGNNSSHSQPSAPHREISVTQRSRWAIRDRARFQDLVDTISLMVSDLVHIVPKSTFGIPGTIADDIRKLQSTRALNTVLDSTKGFDDLEYLASAAEEKLAKQAQTQIRRILWFRRLEERKSDIKSACPTTFDWAFESWQNFKWGNLAHWLADGTGIYLLHGKPGSGKSTLMKHIYTHEKMPLLLERWAGHLRCVTADFFFYAMGTDEQKSMDGLRRSLLYQILEAIPSLTAVLLPHMWREIYRCEGDNVVPPSATELKQAFAKLSSLGLADVRICLFIDGLDEFDGDFGAGIALFEELAKNPNIKLLISSRPMPEILEAFKDGPQLRLQDLTKPDIAQYIQTKVAEHEYIAQLERKFPGTICKVVSDLQTKASGVFFWVVLACRSLLDGFTKKDRLEDLQYRINELPPELNDLFVHILKRIPHLYHDKAAKLLQVVYEQQRTKSTSDISALCLSALEEHGMDISKVGSFERLSDVGTRAKLEEFEIRLLSLCCGLLEIKLLREDGWKSIEEAASVWKEDHGVVTFMHRTVFEFMHSPQWFKDLQVQDEHFDPHVILSWLSLHAAWINREHLEAGIGRRPKMQHDLTDMFTYASMASPFSDSAVSVVLRRISEIMSWTGRGYSDSRFSERDRHTVNPTDDIDMVIAVEAGLLSFIQARCERGYSANVSSPQGKPLIHHAVCRPNLSKLNVQLSSRNVTASIVYLLLQHGAEPCEEAKVQELLQDLEDASEHGPRKRQKIRNIKKSIA